MQANELVVENFPEFESQSIQSNASSAQVQNRDNAASSKSPRKSNLPGAATYLIPGQKRKGKSQARDKTHGEGNKKQSEIDVDHAKAGSIRNRKDSPRKQKKSFLDSDYGSESKEASDQSYRSSRVNESSREPLNKRPIRDPYAKHQPSKSLNKSEESSSESSDQDSLSRSSSSSSGPSYHEGQQPVIADISGSNESDETDRDQSALAVGVKKIDLRNAKTDPEKGSLPRGKTESSRDGFKGGKSTDLTSGAFKEFKSKTIEVVDEESKRNESEESSDLEVKNVSTKSPVKSAKNTSMRQRRRKTELIQRENSMDEVLQSMKSGVPAVIELSDPKVNKTDKHEAKNEAEVSEDSEKGAENEDKRRLLPDWLKAEEKEEVNPMEMTCPSCERFITTEVSIYFSSAAWLICTLMCLLGLWCLCFVPFCMGKKRKMLLRDCEHRCPHCQTLIAYKHCG